MPLSKRKYNTKKLNKKRKYNTKKGNKKRKYTKKQKIIGGVNDKGGVDPKLILYIPNKGSNKITTRKRKRKSKSDTPPPISSLSSKEHKKIKMPKDLFTTLPEDLIDKITSEIVNPTKRFTKTNHYTPLSELKYSLLNTHHAFKDNDILKRHSKIDEKKILKRRLKRRLEEILNKKKNGTNLLKKHWDYHPKVWKTFYEPANQLEMLDMYGEEMEITPRYPESARISKKTDEDKKTDEEKIKLLRDAIAILEAEERAKEAKKDSDSDNYLPPIDWSDYDDDDN